MFKLEYRQNIDAKLNGAKQESQGRVRVQLSLLCYIPRPPRNSKTSQENGGRVRERFQGHKLPTYRSHARPLSYCGILSEQNQRSAAYRSTKETDTSFEQAAEGGRGEEAKTDAQTA